MPRAEANTSRTLGNATMEKCECPHGGRGLAWQGQSLAEIEPSPTWSLLLPAQGRMAANEPSSSAWVRSAVEV